MASSSFEVYLRARILAMIKVVNRLWNPAKDTQSMKSMRSAKRQIHLLLADNLKDILGLIGTAVLSGTQWMVMVVMLRGRGRVQL